MRLASLMIITSAIVSFSQTQFPTPTQLPIASGGNWTVDSTIIIGDYDGYGRNDVLVRFKSCVPDGFGGCAGVPSYAVCIYSYAKSAYLLQLSFPNGIPPISYGDLTSDFAGGQNTHSIVEVIIGNTIYAYNPTLVKKKS